MQTITLSLKTVIYFNQIVPNKATAELLHRATHSGVSFMNDSVFLKK